ncbi:MAG: single-stranded-DNA-specific exonuclease RecJ [Microcoleaceae cyanobacterium]
MTKLPNQRWQIAPPQPEIAQSLATETGLSPLLAQILINRGIETIGQAGVFLDPETQVLPSPLEAFPDLQNSVDILQQAIANREKIAICGDYDADGMTSTALLIRSLKRLGADVNYAIPSRMKEGYGINCRIVEEFLQNGVQIILTVDNGIAAYEPIARARELGLTVIVTDHHDIPERLPPANAILNPKLIEPASPYYGLAGVGVAYALAACLAQQMEQLSGLVHPLLELFTLGTIADLAPLSGVNRRWVRRGLQRLPQSDIPGIQALIQVAGVGGKQETLKPDDIGFRLGPRINAVGRIAEPQIVIELLTTDDPGIALERAMQCEQINQERQRLCERIEQEAVAWCQQQRINFQQTRVLVIVQPDWHHGVIGIVASRLVDRYGVPVFIGTYEDEAASNQELATIRGSARGIPEFHVFEALQFCQDLLGKFGGHRAAGGFSLPTENLKKFQERLQEFAHQCLDIQHLKPLVVIDAEAQLSEINLDLYHQIDQLQPCGIQNKPPTFWTKEVRVVRQKLVGKGHIKLTLAPDRSGEIVPRIEAIAWRWKDYFPLPTVIDIAYQLRENNWNDQITVELELKGVRLPEVNSSKTPLKQLPLPLKQISSQSVSYRTESQDVIVFHYENRLYTCALTQSGSVQELRVRNATGQVLAVPVGERVGLLGISRAEAREIDTAQPFFSCLLQAAFQALKIQGW